MGDQHDDFRRRVERGAYDGLFDGAVRAILRQGAAIGGVEDELGAIRYALAKLLAEEPDANRLAAGVARLCTAAVQVLRQAQRVPDTGGHALDEVMRQILAEIAAENEREQREALGSGEDDERDDGAGAGSAAVRAGTDRPGTGERV